MPPTLIFFRAEKRKIHLILSASVTADDFDAFSNPALYRIVKVDDDDDRRSVEVKSATIAADGMEVFLELRSNLDEFGTYRLTLDASGDTVSALKASYAGYPDPRESIEEEIAEEIEEIEEKISALTKSVESSASTLKDEIEEKISALTKSVETSTITLKSAIEGATNLITGTPSAPPVPPSRAATMAMPPDPAAHPGNIAGVRQDVLTASNQVSSSIHGLADRMVDHFGRGVTDSLLGFPFQTEQVTPRTTPSTSSTPSYGGTSLQNTVDAAIRSVLGRPVNAGDPKSFQASLNAAFAIRQFEGHTVWTYTPRSFAGAAEFGESMTGMVASLVAMANNARDQTLPMIDALTSLDPTVEPDALEAKRAIVRTEWNEFVLELQTTGGPRAARADMILAGLTNPNGYLFEFGVDLGMVDASNQITRQRVITLDDEDNLTKYISVRDYISAISHSWLNYRNNFYLTDLGTTLLNLSRALSVVSDELIDLTDALDSVYVGQAERLTIRVTINVNVDNPPAIPTGTGAGEPVPPPNLHNLPPGSVGDTVTSDVSETSMVLQDVIDWIDRFVKVEAAQLISTSGRRGAAVIQNTANVLQSVVMNIIDDVTRTHPAKSQGVFMSKIPVGMRHPRVRIPLRDLADGLHNILIAATYTVQDTASTTATLPRPVGPHPRTFVAKPAVATR